MISSSFSELQKAKRIFAANPCLGAIFESVRLANALEVSNFDIAEMPMAASQAIVLGIENSRLFELAAASRTDPPLDLLDLYLRFCDDIGWDILLRSESDCWMHLARSWAQLWLCGLLSPYQASERIWRQITRAVPEAELDPYLNFIALASDWEDHPEARDGLEATMEECLAALALEWEVV